MFYNFVINPIVLLYKWLYLSLFGLTGSYGISLLLMSVITFLVTSPFMRWAGRIQKNEKHIQDILKPQIETIRLFFASLKSPLLQNKFPRHRVGNFIPQIS